MRQRKASPFAPWIGMCSALLTTLYLISGLICTVEASQHVVAEDSSLLERASLVAYGRVELRWRDNAEAETAFEIEAREVFGSYQTLFTLPKDRERVVIRQLPEGAVRMFRVRARNESGPSHFSNEVLVATPVTPSACTADETTLCLQGNRFRVQASYDTGSRAGNAGLRPSPPTAVRSGSSTLKTSSSSSRCSTAARRTNASGSSPSG